MTTVPGSNPNALSVLINTAGGITAAGLGAAGAGSVVTIESDGRVEIMGTVNSGGRLYQVFGDVDTDDNPETPNETVMLSQSVRWSGRESDIVMDSSSRIFIGGSTLNAAGSVVQTGGYLNASREIDIRGGTDYTGFGLLVHGASEIVAEGTWDYDANGAQLTRTVGRTYKDGSIKLSGVGDVDMQGLLISGGRSEMQRDQLGKYIGRNIVRYDVDSTIQVKADRQLIIGTDITAGKQVDLIGGLDSRPESSGSPYEGRGMVLYGSASVTTTRANSEINLNAPGRVDILAPGDVNQLDVAGWANRADGKLNRDVTLVFQIDKVSFTVEAVVTVRAADTLDNTTIDHLMADLDAVLQAASWVVVQTDDPNQIATPALGTTYLTMPNIPDYSAQSPDIKTKLRDGRLMFASPYEIQIRANATASAKAAADALATTAGLSLPPASTTHAEDLGIALINTAPGAILDGGSVVAVQSARRYAVDAAAVGSTVTIGSPEGPNGKLYIAGKVRAHSAINLNSGISSDGKDIDLDATGVLETVDGNIEFSAGENGVLQGDVIARGAGRDVILSSERSLTIEGLIQANDRIILTGGDGTYISDSSVSGYRSLDIKNTAKITTLDAHGGIRLTGTNQVYIDGEIETTRADHDVSINSDLGDVILNETSGRITVAGQLNIGAVNVYLDGPINSTYDNGTSTAEVLIIADQTASLNGNATIDQDAKIVAGALSMAGAVWKAGTLTIEAGQIDLGNIALNKGATIETESLLDVFALGKMVVNRGVLMTSNAASSVIEIDVGSIDVLGAISAGATIDAGAIVKSADGADLTIRATDLIRVMNGTASDSTLIGGTVEATRNVTLVGGLGVSNTRYAGSGLWLESRARVESLNVAGTASSTVLLDSALDVRIDGFVNATAGGGVIDVRANRMIGISGMLYGHDTIKLDGGRVDAIGMSVVTDTLVYDGNLDRLTGAILETGQAGNVIITARGGMRLDGLIGQPPTNATRTSTVEIESTGSTDVLIYADINAQNRIELIGERITLGEGSLLKTHVSTTSSIELLARGQLWVQSDQTGLGDAIIASQGWVHLRGSAVYQAGRVEAFDAIWLNAVRDITVFGALLSTGGQNVTFKAGLASGVSNGAGSGESRGSYVRTSSSLGAGSIYLLGAGKVTTTGQFEALAGTDVIVDASATGAGSRLVSTPVIGTEQVQYQKITGYTQVVDAVIDVPVVKWVSTTVTEQVGLESVKSGYYFTTMDVTLRQDGYWNGTTKREWFVEGVDYQNFSGRSGTFTGPVIDWADFGLGTADADLKSSSGLAKTFNELNDLQRDSVIATLGYKKLYNFEYSNLQKHQVINGNTTIVKWDPVWSLDPPAGKAKAMQVVNLNVAGLEDKWINVPVGAEADLLRAVSQGTPVRLQDELVGRYRDEARVFYDKIYSTYRPQRVSGIERLHDPNESYTPSRMTTDSDNQEDRWKVTYDSNGKRLYDLVDRNIDVDHFALPLWESSNTWENVVDRTGVRIQSKSGYNPTTASISTQQTLNDGVRNVGTYYTYVPKYYRVTSESLNFYEATQRYNLANAISWTQRRAIDDITTGGRYRVGMVYLNGSVFYDVKAYGWKNFTGVYLGGRGSVAWDSGEPNNAGGGEWTIDIHSTRREPDTLNDIHPDTRLRAIVEYGGYWSGRTVTETFIDYKKDWKSGWTNVYDRRFALNQQWVTNQVDVFDNRPKFRTYDVSTKVVETAKVTLYKDQPTYQTVTETRSVRFDNGGVGQSFGLFGRDSIDVGTLILGATRDVALSGIVKVGANASIDADRDILTASAQTTVVNGVETPNNAVEVTVGGDYSATADRRKRCSMLHHC